VTSLGARAGARNPSCGSGVRRHVDITEHALALHPLRALWRQPHPAFTARTWPPGDARSVVSTPLGTTGRKTPRRDRPGRHAARVTRSSGPRPCRR
jgi:hypothetical protein